MNEVERKLLFELAGKTAVLKHETEALKEIVIALSIMLAEKTKTPLIDIAATLELIRMATRWRKSEETADMMRYMTDTIASLSQSETFTPVEFLILDSLRFRDAGDSLRDALRTWTAQATTDELSGDFLQMLARLIAESSSSPLPQDKPHES